MAGSATVGILRVLLSANTAEFEAAMDKASKSMGVISKDLNSFGQAATQVGARLTAAITVPLVGLATAALKTGTDFEKVMNSISGVLTPTAAEMEKVRATAMKMGADTVFSATDAAEAILEMGKAGFTTAEALESVDEVLQLAAASGFTMAEAAEMSARTLNAFGLEVSDLAHVNDVLAKGVNTTSLNLGDLQVAFGYIGPIATSFGLSIEQVTASLGIMRDAGIAAETTGRALRQALDSLANPTQAVEEVMTKLGIASFETNGKLMNLSEIVGLLQAKGLTAADSLKLFGDAAGPGMFALVSKGQVALDELTKGLENSTGAAKAMADEMMTGLPGAFERLRGSVETALLAISKAIEPAAVAILGLLEKLADFVTNVLVPGFKALPVPVQAFALAMTAAAAATGPLLILFGQLAIGFGALTNALKVIGPYLTPLLEWLPAIGRVLLGLVSGPIGIASAAIISLGLVWYKWGEDIKRIVAEVFHAVDNFLGGALSETLQKAWNALSNIGEIVSNVASIIKSLLIIAFYELRDAASELWDTLKNKLGAVVDAIGISFTQLTGIATGTVIPAIKTMALVILEAIPGFHSLITAIQWLSDHTPGWTKSTGDAANVLKALADSASGASKASKEAGDATDFWAKAQKEAEQGINSTLQTVTKATVATNTHTTATKGQSEAARAQAAAAREAAQELEKQTAALDRLGIVTAGSVNKALKEYIVLEQTAIKGGADKNVVLAAMLPLYEALHEKAVRSGVGVDAVTAAMARAKAGADALTASFQHLIPNIPLEPLSQLPGTLMEIDAAGAMAAHGNKMLEESYKALGMTSQAELNRMAEEAVQAYQLILRDANATEAQRAEAAQKASEAVKKAHGEIPTFWETNVVPALKRAYETISISLSDNLAKMTLGMQSFSEGVKGIWESLKQSLLNTFSSILKGWIDGFLKNMLSNALSFSSQASTGMTSTFVAGSHSIVNQGSGILTSGFKSIIGAIGGIMSGGMSGILSLMSGMLTSWVGVALAAIGGIIALFSGAFRGGEEGTQVNPARDAFLAQFGPGGTGPGSGFYELGVQLEAAVGSAQAEALHAALRQADTMQEFNAAIAAINAALGGGGGYSTSGLEDQPTSGTYPYQGGTGVLNTNEYFVNPDGSIEMPEEVPGLHEMAAGGFGKVTRPTLFLAGEAGPEEYHFSGANKSLAGTAAGNLTINFHGPVLAEEDYVKDTVAGWIWDAVRSNQHSNLTRGKAAFGLP